MAERELSIVLNAKDNASKKIAQIGDKIGTAMKFAAAGVAAAGVAVAALAVKGVQDFAEIGGAVQDMADRTGLATESISALRVAAQLNGTAIDTVEAAVKKMALTNLDAVSASDGLKKAMQGIGTSFADFSSKSPDQQFETLANAIAHTADKQEQARLATEAFGKAGVDLLPMLASGSFSLAEYAAQAEKLGVSFSPEKAAQAAALGDAMDKMHFAVQGLSLTIGGALAPYITALIENVIVPAVPILLDFAHRGIDAVKTAAAFLGDQMKILWAWMEEVGIVSTTTQAFQQLWDVIQNQLWPAIQNLWVAIQPLIPMWSALAAMIGVLLYGAFILFINVLTIVVSLIASLIDVMATVETQVLKFMAPAIEFATKTFKDFKQTILDTTKIITDAVAAITNLINKAKEMAKMGIGGAVSAISGVFGGGKAAGGSVNSGTTYMVGENGPEFFRPSMSGTIIPNHSLAAAGGGVNVSINIGTVASDIDVRRLASMVGDALMLKLGNNQQI